MRTIEISEFGSSNVLVEGIRDIPTVKPDEVLVKVHAAGVNGPDLVQRRGHYPPPEGASDLLGLEISGSVVDVGSKVTRWSIGDKVCALANGGGYAEYTTVDAEHCMTLPPNVSLLDAAGIPETCFTVWSNCFHEQSTNPGQLFLVHGGAGGIGATAIQLGNAMGLDVYTTCSGEDDTNFTRSLGAKRAIDYNTEDFVEIVKAAGGAHLILDIIGGDYIARNIKAATNDARIVQLAFNKSAKVDINLMPIMLKRLVYTGSTLRSRPTEFKAAIATALQATVWPMFEENKIVPTTHCAMPFTDVVKAHDMMEAGEHRGKILLTFE